MNMARREVSPMEAGRQIDGASEAVHHESSRTLAIQEAYLRPLRERTLGDYWRSLLKRKWVVITVLVIVMTMAILVSARTTPIYDAMTRISISSQSSNPVNLKDNSFVQPIEDEQRDLSTKMEIIQSDTTAEAVVHRLNLDLRPGFAGSAQTKSSGGIPVSGSAAEETIRNEQLIRKIQAGLKIQQIPDTSIVEIKYSDPNPAQAAEIANAIAATFIEQNIKSRYDSTMQAADWLSKQLADLQIKMESSQTKLVQYQKEHSIVGVDDKQNLTTEKLDELNRELTAAQSDRIQKESLYQIATSTNSPESLSPVLQDSTLIALRQRQTDLQAQYAVLSTQFGSGYTRVREIKNQLEQVERSYQEQVQNSINRIKNDYQTALNREQKLQEALATQTGVAEQLNENAIQYKVLKQEADSNRQLYDGLLQQLKEASLAAGLNSSNIHIIDKARMPLHPARPNIPRNLEFAFLIGLVGGIAVAFGLDALDSTVRTPEQAEHISGLPILGLIPLQLAGDKAVASIAKARLLNKLPRSSTIPRLLITYLEPKSEIAEAYRALRTSLLLSRPSHPPRRILITSSVPKDGKTMSCVNIAIVLAQMGKRVLLLDADMRRPSIHKTFGLSGETGLSNVLSGGASVESAIQPTLQANLYILAAGATPPHPSELLGSSAMENLLETMCDHYDHIIIDSPPVISVTDPVLLSARTDAVLLVVRSGQTTSAQVRRTLDLLHAVQARMLGIIVNAANLTSPDYYHYYYGSKYHSYADEEQSEQTIDELR